MAVHTIDGVRVECMCKLGARGQKQKEKRGFIFTSISVFPEFYSVECAHVQVKKKHTSSHFC